MLLGLDLGTTNVKAAVATEEGQVLGEGSVPVHLFHSGRRRGTEYRRDLVRHARRDRPSLPDCGPIAIKRSAFPVKAAPCSFWMRCIVRRARSSVGSTAEGPATMNDSPTSWGAPGSGNTLCHGGSALAVGQLARLRREQPDLLQPPNRVGFVGDVITGRFCGRPRTTGPRVRLHCSMTPFSRLRCRAPSPTGPDARQLPELVSPPAPAGELLPEPRQQTGLPAGIPISLPFTINTPRREAVLPCRAATSCLVPARPGSCWP